MKNVRPKNVSFGIGLFYPLYNIWKMSGVKTFRQMVSLMSPLYPLLNWTNVISIIAFDWIRFKFQVLWIINANNCASNRSYWYILYKPTIYFSYKIINYFAWNPPRNILWWSLCVYNYDANMTYFVCFVLYILRPVHKKAGQWDLIKDFNF